MRIMPFTVGATAESNFSRFHEFSVELLSREDAAAASAASVC
jgi:hypothetical protein